MFMNKGSAGNQRKPCDKAHGKEGNNLEISKGVKDPEAKGEIQGQIQAMGVRYKNVSTPKTTQFKI